MPALARPCTSGVETSKHMQVTCWHCGCWDHYECVDNQYLSPYRTGGKWLPWFLRKSRPFIFKYRPLGPTYFNIWGIFTIVGIFLIKWYDIPLMQFASLTLRALILKSCRQQIFIKKLKNKIFHFFFKIIQYPFNGIFQINFYVRVPLNNTKNHFHKGKKTRKTDFYIFVLNGIKIIQYPFNGIFHISFCVRVPLNNTKTIFTRKKTRKNRFLYSCHKMV